MSRSAVFVSAAARSPCSVRRRPRPPAGRRRAADPARGVGHQARRRYRRPAGRLHRLRLRHQWRPAAPPLTGWKDFRRCRPEANGLREVYFRYDDEIEYWAKANNLEGQMEQYVGTKTYGFPIKVSALIDEAGDRPRHPHRHRPARSHRRPRRGLPAAQFPQCAARPRRLDMRGPGRRRRRDAGHRRLHQAALREADRRCHPRRARDAASAQARPEPVRSALRQGDDQPVREQCPLRARPNEVNANAPHDRCATIGVAGGAGVL